MDYLRFTHVARTTASQNYNRRAWVSICQSSIVQLSQYRSIVQPRQYREPSEFLPRYTGLSVGPVVVIIRYHTA